MLGHKYNSVWFDRKQKQEENDQRGLTIMLMAVVAIFFLCNVLAMVSNILEAFNVNAVILTQVKTMFPRQLNL